MKVKSKYKLVSTRDSIDTNGMGNRDGSGNVTVSVVHLIPEAREVLYRYQDEFRHTNGCVINASMAINDIILYWQQISDDNDLNLYPGYDPFAYEDSDPIKDGTPVKHRDRIGSFQGYLPGDNCLVMFHDGETIIKETLRLVEVEVI